MSLSAGTRLGPYEVLTPLGAGGMGEVYRARDAKLNGDVAIRVLLRTVIFLASPTGMKYIYTLVGVVQERQLSPTRPTLRSDQRPSTHHRLRTA